MADTAVTAPEVVSQEGALVGDDAQPDAFEPTVEVTSDTEAAPVSPPRQPDSGSAVRHETLVRLDRVITDPSSPEAVLVPDAGRGPLDLPIHSLSAPRPEDVFAEGASKPVEISDKTRERAGREGRVAAEVEAERKKS